MPGRSKKGKIAARSKPPVPLARGWSGEFIPAEKFREAEQLVQASDALVIAGSSLVVNSGIRLLDRARRRRLPIVIVNRGETRGDGRATVKVDAGTSDVLAELASRLPSI